MKKHAIVYTVDDNPEVLSQLIMSLKSVRRFEQEQHDIYVLTDKQHSWVQSLYEAKIVDVSPLVEKYELNKTGVLWKGRPVPPMLLFRLLIPVVPELSDYDRILYLDADTEVWNSEFFSILDIDDNHEVIAIRDSLSSKGTVSRINQLKKKSTSSNPEGRWDSLISGQIGYANSGVLVFNNTLLRDKYEDRLHLILDKLQELKPEYPDQDILNVYYDINVLQDKRYNSWTFMDKDVLLRHYVCNFRSRSKTYPIVSVNRPNKILDGVKPNEKLGILSGVVDKVYVLKNKEEQNTDLPIDKWLRANEVKDVHVIDTSYTGKYDRLPRIVPSESIKARHMDNWMGHYRVMLDAIENGYEKIAVFEALYEPNHLEDSLPVLNKDFDLVICTGNGFFIKTDRVKARSSKAYLMNRRSIVTMRRLFESLWDVTTKGRTLRYIHHWLSSSIFSKSRTFVRTSEL